MPKLLPVRVVVCVCVSGVACRVCVQGVCVCLVCVCGLAVIIYNLKRGRSLRHCLLATLCACVCVCATFPLPLSAAPCCLFILCFAHCSTLSTLATADAFLLNKLQTQLTFHAIFSLPRLCALLCPALTHFFTAFPQLMLHPSQTHSPVTRLLQFSPLAFAFLQPLRGFFYLSPPA